MRYLTRGPARTGRCDLSAGPPAADMRALLT